MHLLPIYKTILKREKAQTKDIKDWTEESALCLQECYDCTEWDMFKQSCGDDLDKPVDVTCSCAAFCRDMIISCKQVQKYPKKKTPWVTKSVKSSIQKKKLVFKQGVASDLHRATKELKIEMLKATEL